MDAELRREQCPACAAQGNDNKGDNLVRYEDGHAHCFACGYHEVASGVPSRGPGSSSSSLSKKGGPKLHRGPVTEDNFNVAGILKHAMDKYGVFGLYDNQGELRKLCFPYSDHQGNICRAKARSIAAAPEGGTKLDRDFTFINVKEDPKGTKKMVPLFGWKPINELPSNIIIFEGESDLLTYVSYAKIPEDWHCMALAGAANAKNAAIALNGYKGNVHLVFDQDAAGEKAVLDFLTVRPAAVNTLPLDKDVRDYIARNKYEAPIFTWEKNDGLVQDLNDELDLYQNGMIKEPIIKLPRPFNKMMAPRNGAFFIVAGNTGSGKSFFIDWLINICVNQNKRVLLHSLELMPGEVVARLLYQRTGQRFFNTKDPNIVAMVKRMQKNLFINKGESSLETIRHQISSVGGVDLVVVDTLSLFAKTTEWDSLVRVSYQLKSLSVDASVGSPMVVATSQMSLKNVSPDKVSTDNMFGAAGVAQAADMILYLAANEDGSTNFKVIKRDRVLGNWYSCKCAFNFQHMMYDVIDGDGQEEEYDFDEHYIEEEPYQEPAKEEPKQDNRVKKEEPKEEVPKEEDLKASIFPEPSPFSAPPPQPQPPKPQAPKASAKPTKPLGELTLQERLDMFRDQLINITDTFTPEEKADIEKVFGWTGISFDKQDEEKEINAPEQYTYPQEQAASNSRKTASTWQQRGAVPVDHREKGWRPANGNVPSEVRASKVRASGGGHVRPGLPHPKAQPMDRGKGQLR